VATLRKRGDKWQVRIQCKGLPDLAKTFESKRDAGSWARQIESEILNRRWIEVLILFAVRLRDQRPVTCCERI